MHCLKIGICLDFFEITRFISQPWNKLFYLIWRLIFPLSIFSVFRNEKNIICNISFLFFFSCRSITKRFITNPYRIFFSCLHYSIYLDRYQLLYYGKWKIIHIYQRKKVKALCLFSDFVYLEGILLLSIKVRYWFFSDRGILAPYLIAVLLFRNVQ